METVIVTLMNLVAYIVPFIIIYFVVAAGVKKGIDSSETGKAILENYLVKKKDK